MLIVQYRLTGYWGDDREIECRDDFAFAIDEILQARGLGMFDGRDTGGGASNLFFFVPNERVQAALRVIVEQIERRGLAGNILVARSIVIPKDPDPDIEHRVVWPSDFSGEFDIFKWSGSASE